MRPRQLVAVLCALGLIAGAKAAIPATPTRPVTDTIQGIAITDDYRWLEDAGSPEVKDWSDAQNRYTRSWFDALPDYAAVRARVQYIQDHNPPSFGALVHRGSTLFAIENLPPKQQPFLVAMTSADDSKPRTILDPNLLDPSGGTSMDWYVPSHDGTRVAVSLSKGGSESGDVHVYEVATGKELGEPVPRVNGGTAGGSVAWNADGSGFWYTRYPRGDERPTEDQQFYVQVYYHRVGQPGAQDTYAIGKEFPKIAEIELSTSDDGKQLLVDVKNGDGGEHGFWLLSDGNWTHVAHFEDRAVAAAFGLDGALYVKSLYGAPKGRILRVPLTTPDIDSASVVVPEGEGAISAFVATASKL